jgi:hypothetical protein
MDTIFADSIGERNEEMHEWFSALNHLPISHQWPILRHLDIRKHVPPEGRASARPGSCTNGP